MVIRQQYYTSCRNPANPQRTGFQVKAESPRMSAYAANLLSKLSGYSIPSQADPEDINSHPIALRYYAVEGEAMLIGSQSNGKDEMNRPGNYFVHSVVGSPEEIAPYFAPIFYWGSPFWVSKDESNQTELPILSEFDVEVTFDFDDLWTFLQQGKRRQWFYSLLCAVMDYHQSQRKIVILDHNESVAFWIAAVSTALPLRYSHYLTFATYHHDPYSAPFIITGTTADSSFRFTNDEYISYFVLNALEGRISEAPDSDYAQFICSRFEPEGYEGEILDFFNWGERFEIESHSITRKLDSLSVFWLATVKNALDINSDKVIRAGEVVIQEISQKSHLESEDVEDANHGWEILRDAIIQRPSQELIENYCLALKTLKRSDTQFPKTCVGSFYILAMLVLNKRQEEAHALDSVLKQLYSQDVLASTLQQPKLIQMLAEQLRVDDEEQVLIFWDYLGSKLRLHENNKEYFKTLLGKTFAVLQRQGTEDIFQVPESATKIISLLLTAKSLTADLILNHAAESERQYPVVLRWVYYSLVQQVPINQRPARYWSYWPTLPQLTPLYQYELQRDLLASGGTSQAINVVLMWTEVIQPQYRPNIVSEALDFLQSQVRGINQQELAHEFLLHDYLVTAINPGKYQQLVAQVLTGAKIRRVNQSTAALYQKLMADRKLRITQENKTIIQGVLDLFNKRLQEGTIPQLQQRYGSLDEETYEEEVRELFNSLFAASQADPGSHFRLVAAVYMTKRRELFWKIYWEQFKVCLLEEKRIVDIVVTLDMWFKASGDLVERYPYVFPEFFTQLPKFLEELKASKNYKAAQKEFEKRLRKKDWYPVIQKYIQSRHNLLSNIFTK